MRMGQGVRTGLGHGCITCVLQTQFSSLPSRIHIVYHIEHRNPLYPGRFFHWYMLDKSICNFRGIRSILSLLFYFVMENPV